MSLQVPDTVEHHLGPRELPPSPELSENVASPKNAGRCVKHLDIIRHWPGLLRLTRGIEPNSITNKQGGDLGPHSVTNFRPRYEMLRTYEDREHQTTVPPNLWRCK